MQTPTRVRRGLEVPEIDTKQPLDHSTSYPGLPLARSYNGLPTPPQSAHESRRPSFQCPAVQDVPFSATSSSFTYSQPATPIHNIQPVDAFAQTWPVHDGSHTDLATVSLGHIPDQHLQAGFQHQPKCTLQQLSIVSPYSPPNPSTADGFGVPIQSDISPSQFWQSSQNVTNVIPGHDTCLGAALFPFGHDDAVGSTSSSLYGNLSTSINDLESGFETPSTTGLQAYGASTALYQDTQVVVPSQLTPQDDCSQQNWSDYANPDQDGEGISSSFGSSVGTLGSFEIVRPSSPMKAYTTQSEDEDYMMVNGEEFQSHDDGNASYYPMSDFAQMSLRSRKRSSKRLRQAGRGNCWHKQYVLGVEVSCEGKQFRLEKGVKYETANASKPHWCQHTEKNGTRCNARFERSEHLKRHMGKHSPARPFPCPIPGCKTSGVQRSDNAKDHFKTHLKPHKKGKRNVHVEWSVLHRAICDRYEDKKAAMKLLDNLRKWYENGMPGTPAAARTG